MFTAKKKFCVVHPVRGRLTSLLLNVGVFLLEMQNQEYLFIG